MNCLIRAQSLKRVTLVGFAAILISSPGCRAPCGIVAAGDPHHVIVLPGILGHTPGLDRIRQAVESQLPDASAQVWDWTKIDRHWFPNPIGYIREYDKNRERSRRLATEITRFRRENPEVRLSIIAISGGTAITLFTCEQLPDEVIFDRIILLSTALSPDYNITPALKRSQHGVVNYWSRGDWLVLKRGTSRFGTGDRVFGPSAGYCGFNEPQSCGDLCGKLTQFAWHEGLRRLGNRGGHSGGQERAFLQNCVMKWLSGDLAACAP